jgi:biopolymer transport protein ExbD
MAGGSNTDSSGFTSEPNVVPMIDILLVLLIIFMMTIVQDRKAMNVQIPPEEQVERQAAEESDQIVLELLEDGGYAINTAPYTKSQLNAALHEIYDNRPAKLMFVKTARSRQYQDVIEAIDIARGAGVQVVGFTPPDKAAEEGS